MSVRKEPLPIASRSARRPIASLVLGWVAVSTSVFIGCFWAFWGSIENFHEGWFHPSLWQNLELMIVQYLSPMLVIVITSSIALCWPRTALLLFGAAAVAVALYFRHSRAAIVLIALPLAGLGLLYYFGRPQPRRWALRSVVGLPLITALACGAYPGWLATHRFDDGNYGMRLIEGNGITLVWAPQGPGWPSHHFSWQQARQNCAYLAADGHSLADQPQNLWRLPTVDEAVRSMVFRGKNAGGTWNPVLREAHYRVTPQKDSPLWNAHSQVIYWWTNTEADGGRAYRIAYNGMVFPFTYRGWGDYWAYRCVREPS